MQPTEAETEWEPRLGPAGLLLPAPAILSFPSPALKTPPSLVKSQYGLELSYRCHPIVSFLVLITRSGYVRCHRWGKLSERCTGALCTMFAASYDSKIISESKSLLKKYPRLQDPPKCRFSTKRLRLSWGPVSVWATSALCTHCYSPSHILHCASGVQARTGPPSRPGRPRSGATLSLQRDPHPTPRQPTHRVLGAVGAH